MTNKTFGILYGIILLVAVAFPLYDRLSAQTVSPPVASAPPAGAVKIDPAPGPAIGAGQIGVPTYVLPPQPAVVQTKGGGFINVGQAFGDMLSPYVDALVQAVLAALVGWVVLQIKQRTGVQIEDSRRDALTRFLQNEAGSLIADGKVRLNGLKVEVGDDALANSANRALSKVPDAMKQFGLTPEAVSARIVDMIPQVTAGAQMIAQAHAKAAAAPATTGVTVKPAGSQTPA